jgi:hypothetical protein
MVDNGIEKWLKIGLVENGAEKLLKMGLINNLKCD